MRQGLCHALTWEYRVRVSRLKFLSLCLFRHWQARPCRSSLETALARRFLLPSSPPLLCLLSSKLPHGFESARDSDSGRVSPSHGCPRTVTVRPGVRSYAGPGLPARRARPGHWQEQWRAASVPGNSEGNETGPSCQWAGPGRRP